MDVFHLSVNGEGIYMFQPSLRHSTQFLKLFSSPAGSRAGQLQARRLKGSDGWLGTIEECVAGLSHDPIDSSGEGGTMLSLGG